MKRILGELSDDSQLLREAIMHCRDAVANSVGHRLRQHFQAVLGMAAYAWFSREKNPAALDEAVSQLRQGLAPPANATRNNCTFHNHLGVALGDLFDREGDLSLLHESVAEFEFCVKAAERSESDWSLYRSNLGYMTRVLYTYNGDVAALHRALAFSREGMATCPPNNPRRAVILANHGAVLQTVATANGDLTLLDEAITALRRSIAATPNTQPTFAKRVTILKDVLATRATDRGDAAALRLVIETYRELIADPANAADRPELQSFLGMAHQNLYWRTKESVQLDKALVAYAEALALSDGGQRRSDCLFGLANVWHSRHLQEDDPAALAQAIAHARKAVDAAADDETRADRLSFLGLIYFTNFQLTQDMAAGEAAVQTYRDSLALTRVTAVDYAERQRELGEALLELVRGKSDLDRLDEGLSLLSAAGAGDETQGTRHARYLAVAARAWLRRYRFTADADALSRAIVTGRQAVAATDRDSPEYVERLAELAAALGAEARRIRDHETLAEAIATYRQALVLHPAGDQDPADSLSALAFLLQLRFTWSGRSADVDEAVTIHRDLVASTEPGLPRLASRLAAFGSALLEQFRLSGVDDQLASAIEALRRSLITAPADAEQTRARRIELARALFTRYQHTGDARALGESIALNRRVYESTERTDPAAARALQTYTDGLVEQANRLVRPADAANAAALLERAVVDFPGIAALQIGLGTALHAHYSLTHDRMSLERATSALRSGVAASGNDDPSLNYRLARLSGALADLFALTHDATVLDESAGLAERAVNATSATDPVRLNMLMLLAGQKFAQYRQGELSALPKAISCARRALGVSHAAPALRCGAAREYGRYAAEAGQWSLAAEGYRAAVELLPLLADRRLHRRDQERWLSSHGELARDAAACAVHIGDPVGALAVLEQGRGVTLRQGFEARTDIGTLRAEHPEIAERFSRLRDRLHPPVQRLEVPLADSTDAPDAAHRWSSEFTQLIEQIRRLPGYSGFLRGVTIDEMARRVSGGHMVTVNVSKYRCDALALSADGVQLIPLPGLSLNDAVAHAEALRQAAAPPSKMENVAVALKRTLPWLWNVVAEPVLRALDLSEDTRLWWIPTGPLAQLPLHAAGDNGSCAADLVVSSYAPTIHALTSPAGSRSKGHEERALIVAVSNRDDVPPLPYATFEARQVASLIPAEHRICLIDDQATGEEIRSHLPQSTWAHFACHATADPESPSHSRILLADGEVDAEEIGRLLNRDAFLAYLSACGTGSSGAAMPDEGIHLCSSFLLAGFSHAVGSLWQVPDQIAATVATDFYRGLAPGVVDGETIARSLHSALGRLRLRHPDQPELWAPYVHYGT